MNNKEILEIAVKQSAEDIGCKPEDFFSGSNTVVPFRLGKNAKKYYKLPVGCNLISYGNNVVAAAGDELFEIVQEYINKFEFYHCFETPNMYWLNKRIEPLGQTVCFMAEYYLPDVNRLTALSTPYELRVLNQDDLAGCSADADEMWQIGVDVLPEYRRKGIASAITSRLAVEILERGKVPFYCTAWSNMRSVRNAVKSGFIPAWAEMTVKPVSVVDEINGQ